MQAMERFTSGDVFPYPKISQVDDQALGEGYRDLAGVAGREGPIRGNGDLVQQQPLLARYEDFPGKLGIGFEVVRARCCIGRKKGRAM
jgi:hypothetical protein